MTRRSHAVRRFCTLVAAVSVAATGCVTVHGESAVIPSVDRTEAAEVLERFTEATNEANTELDAKLTVPVESGPLAAIDQAGIKARAARNPDGNPGFKPLELTDPKFLIPRTSGWPKWFVADADSNRGGGHWLVVFTRPSPDQAWRASYLSVVSERRMPEPVLDDEGYAEAVPASGSDLLVPPGRLGREYADYLQKGPRAGGSPFADGPATSQLRERRGAQQRTRGKVTQYADQPAGKGDFAPVALRTEDGGALVFFATHHQVKETVGKGYPLNVPPAVRPLVTGDPKTALLQVRVAEQLVTVPSKAAAKKDPDEKVSFLHRVEGLVSARGE
ncbi:hypothetical protein GQS52_20050 [Streptomyces sp. SCUT-3]|uniref:hypothetical protein n=2 Tax=Streptomyces TaxID=1883 RepID=UPI000CC1F830|nr:hypothetical protein [Streptomyces sp. SCUT-3]PLW71197.1 hypothetical protein C0036_19110 [Streptomyces sp. DJ]QMV23685.1 hypothetical protein GQS52_20050 [Streptomyces sp. SCUT-3]